jgi:hypothetical protein
LDMVLSSHRISAILPRSLSDLYPNVLYSMA